MAARLVNLIMMLAGLVTLLQLTSAVKECQRDEECLLGEFCFLPTSSCASCIDCSDYKRNGKRGNEACAKREAECGPCMEGYTEAEDHCLLNAGLINELSSEFEDISKFTWLIFIPVMLALILCGVFVFKKRKMFKSKLLTGKEAEKRRVYHFTSSLPSAPPFEPDGIQSRLPMYSQRPPPYNNTFHPSYARSLVSEAKNITAVPFARGTASGSWKQITTIPNLPGEDAGNPPEMREEPAQEVVENNSEEYDSNIETQHPMLQPLDPMTQVPSLAQSSTYLSTTNVNLFNSPDSNGIGGPSDNGDTDNRTVNSNNNQMEIDNDDNQEDFYDASDTSQIVPDLDNHQQQDDV